MGNRYHSFRGPATNTNSGAVAASMSLIDRQVYYQVKQAEAAVASLGLRTPKRPKDVALAAGQAYFSVLQAQAVVERASGCRAAEHRCGSRRAGECRNRRRADVSAGPGYSAAAQVDLIAARTKWKRPGRNCRPRWAALTESVRVAPRQRAGWSVGHETMVAGAPHRPEVVRSQADCCGARRPSRWHKCAADPPLHGDHRVVGGCVERSHETSRMDVGATGDYYLSDGGGRSHCARPARPGSGSAKQTQAPAVAQVDAITAWISLQDALARVEAGRASEASAAEACAPRKGVIRPGWDDRGSADRTRRAGVRKTLSRIKPSLMRSPPRCGCGTLLAQPVIEGDQ